MADDKSATFDERFYFDLKPAVPDVATAPKTPAERVQFSTVIDPGHGDLVPINKGKSSGFDPGHVRELLPEGGGKSKKVEEREINLSLAHDVRRYLKERGADVTMTHDGLDVRIDSQPHEKAEYNKFRTAVNRDAEAFVSIHNDSGNPNSHGMIIHYNKDSPVSEKYAKVLAATIGHNLKEAVGIHQDDRDLGVLQRDRHMRTDGTEQPAVLIEAINMNHDKDLGRMLDSKLRQAIASGIGTGILSAQVSIDGPIARIPDPNEKVPLPRSRPREL